MAKMNAEILYRYDNDFLLSTKEVAAICDCSTSVISAHRSAGLLPFVPGVRPVKHRVGDVKVYRKMMLNGVKDKLHRSLRIAPEDRQVYSPLHGLMSFTEENYKETINSVIAETDAIWKRYKLAKDEEKKAKRKAA
jgi:hypothetical protein